jgi:hypothetical protein
MDLILTSQPKFGSVLKIEFIDVLDVVSIPEPDADNNLDIDDIVLVSGKTWSSIIPIPGTGQFMLESVTDQQGSYEKPKVVCSYNDASMQILNILNDLCIGRYILIITDGTGAKYLVGTLEEWLTFKYNFDTTLKRSQTQVINIEFGFS